MNFLKGSLIFIIHSNLFISLCAVAFFLTGADLLGVEKNVGEQAVLIFSATFLTYNLTIFLTAWNRPNRKAQGKMAWYLRHRKAIYFLIAVNVILLLLFFPFYSLPEAAFLFHLGLISIFYNIPDRLARTAYRSIRSIPLIKIFLIAYVWSAIGALYPAVIVQDLSSEAFTLFILFFLFILAITLPFDIRDYYSDQKSDLLTIPGLVGVKTTKWIAAFLMLVYSAGIVLFFSVEWPAVLFLSLATLLLIRYASASQPPLYYTGLMDGLIILQYLLIVF